MAVKIFILFLFFCVFLSFFIWSLWEDPDVSVSGVAGALGSLICIAIFLSIVDPPKENPKAIDVYRGKTTLEITYRDSLTLDTTVVWKPEYIKK